MRELFEAHRKFEEARPLTRRSTLWYQERAGHEVDEWLVADPADREAFLSEAADVFIFWSSALASVGVSPEVIHQAILDKIALNEVRFPVELFDGTNGLSYDENYREAKRREGRPVQEHGSGYNQSLLTEEHLGSSD